MRQVGLTEVIQKRFVYLCDIYFNWLKKWKKYTFDLYKLLLNHFGEATLSYKYAKVWIFV